MKIVARFSTLLVALGVLSGCATLGKPTDEQEQIEDDAAIPLADLLAQGNAALRGGDLDAAQVNFALAVEREPDNLDALYKLGVIRFEKGGLDVAEGLLRAALGLDPTHQGSREALGIVLLKQKRLVEAETVLWKALESRPDSWQVMNALGVIADMDSRHAQAQELFSAALHVTSRSAKVTNNLGYSFYLSGDNEEAEFHFRKATDHDPHYVHAWSNLALLYTRTKRYREARAAFDRIGSAHQAANNLGYLGLLGDDAALARTELERAVRLSPSYYEIANRNLASLGDVPVANETTIRRGDIAVPTAALLRVGSPSLAKSSVRAEHAPTRRTTSRSERRRDSRRAAAPMLAYVGFAAHGNGDDALIETVGRFQEAYGLDVDGRVGPKTERVLREMAVTRLQRALVGLGYDVGDVDGRLGGRTREALREFQRDESLRASGEADEATLERIGVVAAS